MDGYISEVRLFGPNWAPRNWALCQGQLLPIAQNQALFSLIGTTYGGDGRTTFALPDLRGRVSVGPGTGAGLSPINIGEKGGSETVTLTTDQVPSHRHLVGCTNSIGNQGTPGGQIPAGETAQAADVYSDASPSTTMNANMIEPTGGNGAHPNRQPFLGISYIICLQGIYPSRN